MKIDKKEVQHQNFPREIREDKHKVYTSSSQTQDYIQFLSTLPSRGGKRANTNQLNFHMDQDFIGPKLSDLVVTSRDGEKEDKDAKKTA
ncbi:hypothetical protein CR513_50471, partial [Mucuna pruriens]